MILDDFVQIDEKGLYCKYGDFYLDPKLPAKTALITHAHADHAVSGNHDVYCTRATASVMQLRYDRTAAKVFNIVGFNQPFTIGKVTITLIPAGHMLGSAQVLMEYKDTRYLYTGDYKLQPDDTCEPIEWVTTDVLITEREVPGLVLPGVWYSHGRARGQDRRWLQTGPRSCRGICSVRW